MKVKDLFPIATRTDEIFLSLSREPKYQLNTVGYLWMKATEEANKEFKRFQTTQQGGGE